MISFVITLCLFGCALAIDTKPGIPQVWLPKTDTGGSHLAFNTLALYSGYRYPPTHPAHDIGKIMDQYGVYPEPNSVDGVSVRTLDAGAASQTLKGVIGYDRGAARNVFDDKVAQFEADIGLDYDSYRCQKMLPLYKKMQNRIEWPMPWHQDLLARIYECRSNGHI